MDFIASVAMLQSTVTYVMEAITFCWSLKDKENTCSEAADDRLLDNALSSTERYRSLRGQDT